MRNKKLDRVIQQMENYLECWKQFNQFVILARGKKFGLVKTRDGLVQRVLPGNYLGQNEGRITQIDASRIDISEIVPDGLGGFMERNAALPLNE